MDDQNWTRPTLAKAQRLLTATGELYGERSRATSLAFARDRHGHDLGLECLNDPRAVRWSVVRAVLRAAYTEFNVETVVIHEPPGSPLRVRGPKFVLCATALLCQTLIELHQQKKPISQPWKPSDQGSNPLLELLDGATPAAWDFWISEVVTWLPYIRRRDGVHALAVAAAFAQTLAASERASGRAGHDKAAAGEPGRCRVGAV